MNAIVGALTPSSPDIELHGIEVTPLGPVLGAEISNIDLREPLSPEQAKALRALWVRHKVLVFRDQDLTHEQHIAFTRLFGELEGHPVTQHVPGHPEVLIISSDEIRKFVPTADVLNFYKTLNKWHADVTFRERPSLGSALRSRVIPRFGGDTIFADAVAVYDALPADVKARIETLEAEHDILKSFGFRVSDEKRAELAREYPPRLHPVVRRHPETGEKLLFVNSAFTNRIVGLPEAEAEGLLKYLLDQIKVPEHQVRIRWGVNSIVLWDNRSTQHYAVGDYWPEERILERVTLAGDDVPHR